MDPAGHLASRLDVQVLTYIVTRHNSSTFSTPFVMLLVAVPVFGIGLGLRFLKKWARYALMVASGGTEFFGYAALWSIGLLAPLH